MSGQCDATLGNLMPQEVQHRSLREPMRRRHNFPMGHLRPLGFEHAKFVQLECLIIESRGTDYRDRYWGGREHGRLGGAQMEECSNSRIVAV